MQHRHLYLVFVILTVCAIVMWFCNRSVVRYVVPDGYRGEVMLIADPDAPPTSPFCGTVTLRIPSGGQLRLRDLDFLNQWHEVEVRYAGGQSINSRDPTPEEVGFRSIGASHGGARVYWFVGTEREMRQSEVYRWITSAPSRSPPASVPDATPIQNSGG